MPSIGKKVIAAGIWTLSQQFATQLISLLRVVILARLIAPSDFGAFAIALVALAFIEAFSSTGLEDALIQRKSLTKEAIHTAWIIQCSRGVALSVATYFLAYPIANFMETPAAVRSIEIISLAPLIRGLVSIELTLMIRSINFRANSILNLIDQIISLALSVVLIEYFEGSVALTLGIIVGGIARTIGSYIFAPYYPRWCFSGTESRSLFSFGKWIFFNRVLFFILIRIDAIVVGKLLGATVLGAYQMATRIGEISSKSIGSVINIVSFSAYSRLQDDTSRMKRSFLLTTSVVASISLPIAAWISAASSIIVEVALGPNWIGVAQIHRLVVWSASLRTIAGSAGTVFKASGNPRLDFFMSLLRGVVLLIIIVPFTIHWGATGTASALLISTVAIYPVMFWMLKRTKLASPGELIITLLPAILLTIASYLASTSVLNIAIDIPYLLALSILSFLVTYTFTSLTLYFTFSTGPFVFLKSALERHQK
jgi:O-antigen/teichoic acid export membrane protein